MRFRQAGTRSLRAAPTAWGIGPVGAILAALAVAGCEQALRYPRPLPPISDRLRAAYPDLGTGRFMVVADFERPEQAAMFATAPGSTTAAPRITALRARNETGAGSLSMYFDSPLAAVVAADDPAADWSLPRDWSAFQMLLMSLHCPRPINTLRITVRGGKPGEVFVQDRLPLEPGWNLIHLDCRDLAARLDLTNVRQVQWSFSRLDNPIILYLDDLLLVDNTQHWGSPDGQAGSLYVTHQARRLHVGAPGRFELVFQRGLISDWYNLDGDPDRSANLVVQGGLGPLPLLLPTSAAEPATQIDFDPVHQWAVLGTTPRARQVLEEASALRAVIRAEWSWETAADEAAQSSDRTVLTWRYVVYPSGRVFVLVDCPTETPAWRADALATAVFCNSGAGFRAIGNTDPEGCGYGLLAQEGAAGPDLLLVPHRTGDGRIDALRSVDDPRVGIMLGGLTLARPRHRAAYLMVIWPGDLDSEPTAASVAADYCRPATLDVDCGRAILTDPGDLNNDGYNESEGAFVLAPQDNLLRFTCDPRGQLRFAPTIKIVEAAGKDVWIYADGRIVRDVARTADGNLIARIAPTIDEPVLVEAHCQDRSGAALAAAGKNAHGP